MMTISPKTDTCDVPELRANVQIINQHKARPVKGDKLQFGCSGGLTLQGSSEIECRAGQTWSDEVPRCSGKHTVSSLFLGL